MSEPRETLAITLPEYMDRLAIPALLTLCDLEDTPENRARLDDYVSAVLRQGDKT